MAIAPQNLMSTLRGMPDAQLQQYAAMHKNDPFVFPLAFQESQDRQRARAAQQAQGQQPPKVVDQDLQQMMPQPAPQPMMPPQQMAQAPQQLPENSGIGQLPAPNLQKMAEGGIVAFGDGGEVPGYAGGPQDKSVVTDPRNPFAYLNPADRWEDIKNYFLRKQQEAAQKGTGNLNGVVPNFEIPESTIKGTGSTEGIDRLATEMAAQQARAGAPAPVIDKAGRPAAPPVAPAAPAAPTGAGQGIGALTEKYKQEFLDSMGKDEVTKEGRMQEFADIRKPTVDKMTALIDQQKNKLGTEKEENFYMSLIQGGLAAAGGTGPNALQNIAQGFEKGAGTYAAGVKDLRKAAQENSKMEMDLARYESSGKEESLKSYYDHQDKRQGLIAAGLGSIYGHGVSGAAQVQGAQINAAGHVAAATAGAQAASQARQTEFETLGNAKPDSALRRGFDLQSMKAHAASLQSDWAKHAYPNGTMGEPNAKFLAMYPDPTTYIKANMQAMNSVTSGGIIDVPNAAAANAPIRGR
jgi:hypothetical protein